MALLGSGCAHFESAGMQSTTCANVGDTKHVETLDLDERFHMLESRLESVIDGEGELSLDQIDVVAKESSPSNKDLLTEIVPREKGKGHGCLAQYGQVPDATNAAHREIFQRLFLLLLGKTDTLRKRTDIFRTRVMDHQLFLLQQRYAALTDYTHLPDARAVPSG